MTVVSFLAVFTDPQVYLSAMAAVLAVQVTLVLVSLRRRADDYDIREPKRLIAPRLSVEGTWARRSRERQIAELSEEATRAEAGFFNPPVARLERAADDRTLAPSVRRYAAEALRRIEPRRSAALISGSGSEQRFDVVMVSNLNLPGGTTSSNVNEIRMLAAGGKTIGLFHHPLYTANSGRPINPKIAELIDGEAVRLIEPRSRVTCELLLMRFPPFAMRMREDLPTIRAEHKMLVINQTPMTYYDRTAGRKRTWDVPTVRRNLSEWIGEHRWTAAGPLVRQVLLEHHADEIEGVELTDDFWYPTLDLAGLARRPHTSPGRPIRIGRHSRDHLSKWPELASDLRNCYPEEADFEIRVLGGTNAVDRLLGRVPSTWTVYPFDSIPVEDFLLELDFYVYFPGSTLLEAFGRAPVEAIASGVPTILPPVFEPVFGDGAVYAEPAQVREVVRSMADDPQSYEVQQKLGLEAIHQRFSFDAHRARLRAVGIDL